VEPFFKGQKLKKNAQYIFYLHILHQRLPNMVKRLFADVIHDAIWFINIHEQNHPFNCLFTFTMECGAYSNNAMSSRSSFKK
jgi:hypothetical protein